MRITADTTSAELEKLRDSFKPRWKAEAARLKSMRSMYKEGTDSRDLAEQRYADFETVATAVIVIDDLRRELESRAAPAEAPAEESESVVAKTEPAVEPGSVSRTEVAHIREHLARGLDIYEEWRESPEIANRPFGDAIAVPAIEDAWEALNSLNRLLR